MANARESGMGATVLRRAAMVVGFSFLWAYVQKGFLSTRLVWVPAGNDEFAAAVLLGSLLLCTAVAAIFRARIERMLASARVPFAVPLVLAVVTESAAFADPSVLAHPATAYSFCVAYYFVHALVLTTLFFGWMLCFLELAYETDLPKTVALLLASMLLSRVITSPYLPIWEHGSRVETVFLAGASLVLWLLCTTGRPQVDVRFSATLDDSSLMKRYLPTFAVYFVSGLLGRIVQSLVENFHQMQVFNLSREILGAVFLATILVVMFLPKSVRGRFSARDVFFLVAGLEMGMVVGQLLFMTLGIPPVQVFFDFIEASRAILLVVSLLLVFLIVYEESVSPVLAFGVFVLGPIILWRIVNLITQSMAPLPLAEWIYGLLLVIIAAMFVVASLLFLFVFVGSNAFMAIFHASSDKTREWRNLIEATAREAGLTARETDIFEYLAMGYTAKRIGEKLYISPYTAQNHIRCIYAKLGVGSKQEVLELVEQRKQAANLH